jgi:hypothetical protein
VRSRWFWTLLLPALVVAEHLGHGLTHWIQEPDARVRENLLAESGHGYMGYLSTLVALCVVLVVAGLAGRVVAGFRRRPLHGLPSWWWAALPVAVFAVQETLGVLAYDGAAGLIPASVLGLGAVLELAAGLLCLLVVRKLSVAAHRAGRALAARQSGRPRGVAAPALAALLEIALLRLGAPAYGGGKRAPPAFG